MTEEAEEPENYPEESCNATDDEEGAVKVDCNACEHVGGVGVNSEGEGRQTDSGSMSSRSESKPYSSVTHKCEVRYLCQRQTSFCLDHSIRTLSGAVFEYCILMSPMSPLSLGTWVPPTHTPAKKKILKFWNARFYYKIHFIVLLYCVNFIPCLNLFSSFLIISFDKIVNICLR